MHINLNSEHEKRNMSLPKDYSLIAIFRKCNYKTLPSLSPEAEIVKGEFSAFLKTVFKKSSCDDLLCRVEDVRLQIVNKMESQDMRMKLHANEHLDNLAQIVQQMYIDLKFMVKIGQQCQGKEYYFKQLREIDK